MAGAEVVVGVVVVDNAIDGVVVIGLGITHTKPTFLFFRLMMHYNKQSKRVNPFQTIYDTVNRQPKKISTFPAEERTVSFGSSAPNVAFS